MYRQSEKKLLNSNISSALASLWHPSKFQRASSLGFVTAPMLLAGGQPNLVRFWPSPGLLHYLYIFGGSCPLAEFCHEQNSLCFQVLHSPTFAALLNGTRAVRISQTSRRGTRNGIMELLLLLIFNRGRHMYSEGSHHVGRRPIF